MKTASWVIINKATGNPLLETFNPAYIQALNTERYKAVPIMEYLTTLNANIKKGA